ncbi:hypothetical protein GQX73_g909 [Xylaria multiplex]|uniref:Uncharacterized protein n=1 Tax=Xylaria multiplex TaxID=323545 RepID=A0A7C8IYW2_9PEZI|nr:hypothetical protein GQX73_g909 [Xylaria multiplex]
MPESCKPHSTLHNVYVDENDLPVVSAWIVVTDEERDVGIQERVCFPRRICLTIGKPISPIAEINLCVASCAIDIAGKLYVISSNVGCAASSVDGTRGVATRWNDYRPHLASIGPAIKDCVRLGHVVYQSPHVQFIVIEVADTFKACRDSECSQCSVPINNNWATSKTSSAGTDPVQLTTVKRWAKNPGSQTSTTKYVIGLEREASNKDSGSFGNYGHYEGYIVGDTTQLSAIDSGSLVSRHKQHIGIVDVLVPGRSSAKVLLFENKLWAHLTPFLNVSERLGEIQGTSSVTRSWQHLEY